MTVLDEQNFSADLHIWYVSNKLAASFLSFPMKPNRSGSQNTIQRFLSSLRYLGARQQSHDQDPIPSAYVYGNSVNRVFFHRDHAITRLAASTAKLSTSTSLKMSQDESNSRNDVRNGTSTGRSNGCCFSNS